MERVEIIEGKKPLIFVAPHGPNDTNTAIIAKTLAQATEGYAVINHGWERASLYDYDKDHANCNDLRHLHEDVVKDEFLLPILRFKNRIKKQNYNFGSHTTWMYTIHGVGSDIRAKANDHKLALVIGYGEGKPPSYTCDPWMKQFFIHDFEDETMYTAYEGRVGGSYAAWSKYNLAQIFRQWYFDDTVQTMQLEIVRDVRATAGTAEMFAWFLATTIDNLTRQSDNWSPPKGMFTKKI